MYSKDVINKASNNMYYTKVQLTRTRKPFVHQAYSFVQLSFATSSGSGALRYPEILYDVFEMYPQKPN